MATRKLLLADDSITIQKVVNLTFADEGIDVISVGDGDTAVQRVFEEMPDIVMADVNMPGLSGYEVCERMRTDEKTRNIPVILLAGAFEKFDEEEAKRVGSSAHLTKPFQSIRLLVNQVTDLIESNRNLAAPDRSDEPEPIESIVEERDYEARTNPSDDPVRSQLETFRDDRITSFDHQEEIQGNPLIEHQAAAAPTESPSGKEPDDIDKLYRQSIGEEPLPSDAELPDLGADDDMIETSYSLAHRESDDLGPSPFLETGPLNFQDEDATSAPQEVLQETQPLSPYETRDLSPSGVPKSEESPGPARTDETVRLDPAIVDVRMAEANRRFEPIEQPPPPAGEPPIGEETIRMDSRFDTQSTASYEFDDIDLLDLASETEVEISTPAETAAKGGNKQVVTLSPDLIEMIAQRVVEKLSEKY